MVPDVLETMFFSTAAETPEAGEGPVEGIHAQVRFRGCPSGVFQLDTDADAIRELAAGFLGVSSYTVREDETEQVACELANMLCGSVLSQAESDTGFELGPPTTGRNLPMFSPDCRAHFTLDTGGYLRTAFKVDDPGEAVR